MPSQGNTVEKEREKRNLLEVKIYIFRPPASFLFLVYISRRLVDFPFYIRIYEAPPGTLGGTISVSLALSR